MKRLNLVSVFAVAVATVAGCSSTPVAPRASTTAAVPSAQSVTPAAPMEAHSSAMSTAALPPYLDPNNPLFKDRSVYFGFDDFSVKPADAPMLERHAKYLVATSSVKIQIEGNADERGSDEYNLALGQKRADAVRKVLEIDGVPENRMEAVSWGKERPKATGHDNAAMAENRRVDLVYPPQ